MTCGKAFEVDLAAFLLEPRSGEWDAFRAHYPSCPECAAEVAAWTTLGTQLGSSHPTPDALLFDFSDSEWHFGLDGAVTMANAYPQTPLLLHHWGCVDAPNFAPFNADPASLPDRVVNPDRIILLAPGEPYELHPLTH